MTAADRPVGSAAKRNVEEVLARLRAAGGRVTSGRRAVVELLAAGGDRHLSAEEIIDLVRARLPEVAESTIYRTLSALEEVGAISHVHLAHGPATFHLSGLPHRHLVCTSCDSVVAVPAELFEQLSDEIERRYGFSIQAEHFALTGECRHCRSSRSEIG